eukprot:TRINITY_DN5331_c1_g1_i1.p1 TRINITY_DN5331_c1_g1~~TRINITY_DN5331_c1_g1_i1.p1  ORF type:complete len:468 (-),score=103.17 TRINITY_DN5331_c1_g1_i1:107-1408(-)
MSVILAEKEVSATGVSECNNLCSPVLLGDGSRLAAEAPARDPAPAAAKHEQDDLPCSSKEADSFPEAASKTKNAVESEEEAAPKALGVDEKVPATTMEEAAKKKEDEEPDEEKTSATTAEEEILDMDERFEDELFAAGFAIELLLESEACEEGLFANGREGVLSSEVRGRAIEFMCILLQRLALQSTKLFEAAVVFDAYHAQTSTTCMDLLPATCVAIVHVVAKMDNARLVLPEEPALWTALCAALVAVLQRDGIADVKAPSVDDVRSQEFALLFKLQGQLRLPYVQWWISLYAGRFNIFTHHRFRTNLGWACSQASLYAQTLMRVAPTASAPPRRLASGLLALNLVRATLVSHHDMRPSTVSPSKWEDLLVSSSLTPEIPTCALGPAESACIRDRVAAAVNVSSTALKENCELVLRTLQSLCGDAAKAAQKS